MVGGDLDSVTKLLARGAALAKDENPLLWMAHQHCGNGAYDCAKLIVDLNVIDAARIEAARSRAQQEGSKRLLKLLGAARAPKKPTARATVRPKTKAPSDPVINAAKLRTNKAREKALDALGAWFVDALLSAADDRKRATAVITKAIKWFYGVRESADQERGENAGHFFMVDAVGIESSDRPVPWSVLEKKATASEIALWQKLFDAAEAKVS